MDRPDVIVFDVNETLSDMAPMGRRFADVGAPPELAVAWFASTLRDGFALATAGASGRFATIASDVLRSLLTGTTGVADLEAAVDHVMQGFLELGVHPDVADGIPALARTGMRLVTLSNGSTDIAERLLSAAGVRQHFERVLSVDDAGVWKPGSEAYGYAARVCAVTPDRMLLVAVHPWDVDGASRAGMQTAWVDRTGAPYPGHFRSPDHSVTDLPQLAELLDRSSTGTGGEHRTS